MACGFDRWQRKAIGRLTERIVPYGSQGFGLKNRVVEPKQRSILISVARQLAKEVCVLKRHARPG